MENKSGNMSVSVLNQDVYKLDKFDGTNFTRWKDKMRFMLTVLNVLYVLDPELQPLPKPSDEDTDKIIADRKKREEDELICRGHILGTLTDRLYDLYANIQSPREIWEALEHKYTTEKKGTDKFLMFRFYEFTLFDNKPILDQVHELLVLVSKLRELKIIIPDPMIVGAIMHKLPQTWNNYRKKLLHMVEDMSLEKLQKSIQIEEETRNRDKSFSSQNFSKVHNVEASKYQKNFKVKNDKGKFKRANYSNKQKNVDGACFHCGKKGHYIRNCRHRKSSEQIANKTNGANMVEDIGSDIVAMISMMDIGMLTEINMASAINSSDWWYDSGATVHVCNDKAQFKKYEAAKGDQEVLMGNHNPAKVLGKGIVELQFTSGKKVTLINVLHVPEIRKNLVFANMICKRGIKAVLESDKLIMSKNGLFVC